MYAPSFLSARPALHKHYALNENPCVKNSFKENYTEESANLIGCY
jgi:hypothetical protein